MKQFCLSCHLANLLKQCRLFILFLKNTSDPSHFFIYYIFARVANNLVQNRPREMARGKNRNLCRIIHQKLCWWTENTFVDPSKWKRMNNFDDQCMRPTCMHDTSASGWAGDLNSKLLRWYSPFPSGWGTLIADYGIYRVGRDVPPQCGNSWATTSSLVVCWWLLSCKEETIQPIHPSPPPSNWFHCQTAIIIKMFLLMLHWWWDVGNVWPTNPPIVCGGTNFLYQRCFLKNKIGTKNCTTNKWWFQPTNWGPLD